MEVLTLHLPQGPLEFELLELGDQAHFRRPGAYEFEPLPELDTFLSSKNGESVKVEGPAYFCLADGQPSELADGCALFNMPDNHKGFAVRYLGDREGSVIAYHWKGQSWHAWNGDENEASQRILIGLAEKVAYGTGVPILAAAPGNRSRTSALAERL